MKKGNGYLCDLALIWGVHLSIANENLGQLEFYFFENVMYM